MYPPAIKRLIEIFSKFPTIGPRTAARIVFYLNQLPNEKIKEILEAIISLKKKIKICAFCFNSFEDKEEKLCPICRDKTRDRKKICIVEKETDLTVIENTKNYKGLYFVLGGTVSRLRKENIKKLRVEELIERIKNPSKFGIDSKFEEIIIATNANVEGEATSLYLERKLKPLNIKISLLGRGLPIGGEIEYADEETLKSAFEGRK